MSRTPSPEPKGDVASQLTLSTSAEFDGKSPDMAPSPDNRGPGHAITKASPCEAPGTTCTTTGDTCLPEASSYVVSGPQPPDSTALAVHACQPLPPVMALSETSPQAPACIKQRPPKRKADTAARPDLSLPKRPALPPAYPGLQRPSRPSDLTSSPGPRLPERPTQAAVYPELIRTQTGLDLRLPQRPNLPVFLQPRPTGIFSFHDEPSEADAETPPSRPSQGGSFGDRGPHP